MSVALPIDRRICCKSLDINTATYMLTARPSVLCSSIPVFPIETEYEEVEIRVKSYAWARECWNSQG